MSKDVKPEDRRCFATRSPESQVMLSVNDLTKFQVVPTQAQVRVSLRAGAVRVLDALTMQVGTVTLALTYRPAGKLLRAAALWPGLAVLAEKPVWLEELPWLLAQALGQALQPAELCVLVSWHGQDGLVQEASARWPYSPLTAALPWPFSPFGSSLPGSSLPGAALPGGLASLEDE